MKKLFNHVFSVGMLLSLGSLALAESENSIQELKSLIRAGRKDTPAGEKATEDLDALFQNGTYSFSNPQVMDAVFESFSCKSSENLYSTLAHRLIRELEVNSKGVMNSALSLQCWRATRDKKIIKKIFECVTGGQVSSYETIDGALQFQWSVAPPVQGDDLAQERYKVLNRMNDVIGAELKDLSTGKLASYNCDLKDTKKIEKIHDELLNFQKALNKYLPISKAQARQLEAKTAHQ